MGDPSRPGPQFLARSAGEGEGGRFPATQPLIVGLGAPSLGDAVLRILGVRTKCGYRVPWDTTACYLSVIPSRPGNCAASVTSYPPCVDRRGILQHLYSTALLPRPSCVPFVIADESAGDR
eukprot:scaffold86944_cov82-Phaeocystis_antarctica.AAC.2